MAPAQGADQCKSVAPAVPDATFCCMIRGYFCIVPANNMEGTMSDQTYLPPSPIPEMRPLQTDDIVPLLRAGWDDYRRAPAFGLAFSAVYVLGGILLWWVFGGSGNELWFIPVAVGFPLLAPFAATGLYEVSRRLETGEPLSWSAVLGCVLRQKDRQVPSMAVVILLAFMFWVFVAHTIFALFFGLSAITSTGLALLATSNGLTMLAVGGTVGGLMAIAVYAVTVVSLPLLLDKEVDFVTAMITSVQAVTAAPIAMLGWAATIAVLLFVGMLPLFLGLFVVLPVLGHATWHLYRRVLPDAA